MITEDYISFETAKLLKEKGFDWNCLHYYKENGDTCINPKSVPDWRLYSWYGKSTLQMAMKWLREKYDLHIIVYPWEVVGEGKDSKHWCCQVYKSFNQLSCSKYTNETVKSYEDACEAAIKYCLENLI